MEQELVVRLDRRGFLKGSGMAGALGLLGGGPALLAVPLMDQAQAATSEEAAQEGFAAAAALILGEGWLINLGDQQDVLLMTEGIGGVVHDMAAGRQVRLEKLTTS